LIIFPLPPDLARLPPPSSPSSLRRTPSKKQVAVLTLIRSVPLARLTVRVSGCRQHEQSFRVSDKAQSLNSATTTRSRPSRDKDQFEGALKLRSRPPPKKQRIFQTRLDTEKQQQPEPRLKTGASAPLQPARLTNASRCRKGGIGPRQDWLQLSACICACSKWIRLQKCTLTRSLFCCLQCNPVLLPTSELNSCHFASRTAGPGPEAPIRPRC
jgi:hypothetical protein